jgi:5-methylthioribose kinase
VPELYHFDEQAHVIIMEDCGVQSLNLKQLMLTATPSPAVAREIGLALGQFLGRLHLWGASSSSLLDYFDQNKQAKVIVSLFLYLSYLMRCTRKLLLGSPTSASYLL